MKPKPIVELHAFQAFLQLVTDHLTCERQTYFRSSLLSLRKLIFGGREATTGNTSAVRMLRITKIGPCLTKSELKSDFMFKQS